MNIWICSVHANQRYAFWCHIGESHVVLKRLEYVTHADQTFLSRTEIAECFCVWTFVEWLDWDPNNNNNYCKTEYISQPINLYNVSGFCKYHLFHRTLQYSYLHSHAVLFILSLFLRVSLKCSPAFIFELRSYT